LKLSKQNEGIIIAYDRGYKVIDGKVYSPFVNRFLEPTLNSKGYLYFSIWIDRKKEIIFIHKLAAYQKFKNKMFKKGIQVRHKDGDRQNNFDVNIKIGTASDNYFDIPEETRIKRSINASSKIRKFSDLKIEEIRIKYKELKSYKKITEIFSISSKGTLHHILNNNYKTVV